MPFEAINCPNCGARLEFESFNFIIGRGTCRFCNTLIRSTAGSEEAERWCKRIYGYEAIGENEQARKAAQQFADAFPGDYRAWMVDYELNAEHDIGVSYNPRPTAIERMCRTAEDDIDKRYLLEVGKSLESDRDAILTRIRELGGEVKRTETKRVSRLKDGWRESVQWEIECIDKQIRGLEEGLPSKRSYAPASYFEYARVFAFVFGLLLATVMISQGCSDGEAYHAFEGIVYGPLAGLFFGAPFGAIIGAIVAGIVNLIRRRIAETAAQEDKQALASLRQTKQERKAELGLAMAAGVIEDELNHLLWADEQLGTALEQIAETAQ